MNGLVAPRLAPSNWCRRGVGVVIALLLQVAVEAAPPDYQAHVTALQPRLGTNGFHVVVQPPFVVVGDQSAAAVKANALHTVKWTIDLLKKDFFTKDPAEIIEVWLFRDAHSYEQNTERFFGEKPISPYGYYSPAHQALIMNIATGGGTLVHEIVHPYMRANFPDCPAWFNEGLGSLFEQCRELEGHIRGLPNWRLASLQELIAAGKLKSFAALTALSDTEFYEGKNAHYAQARYLCYYLQERGLLVKYYHAFVANQTQDPTGYATLQEILGKPDMQKFQREWEQFVLKLRFP